MLDTKDDLKKKKIKNKIDVEIIWLIFSNTEVLRATILTNFGKGV
jgi:hypothetical protein